MGDIRKVGNIHFDNFSDIYVEVDPEAPEGEKITNVKNAFDGQSIGFTPTLGRNAIIKQMTQTVDEDFKVAFEVELTDEENTFALSTTKRAIIFLCRDADNVPTILTPGRRQTSYCYYITAEAGFLCVRTNASGTDTMALVLPNGTNQKCKAVLENKKIKVTLENTADDPLSKMGYVKLPNGYHWDVKVIAF